MVTSRDEPSDYPIDAMSYDDWLRTSYEHPTLDHDGSRVVLTPDGRLVAWALLGTDGAGRGLNEFTATRPEYRGRRLARLAKLAVAAWARDNGIDVLYTGNDAVNAPMLAINRRLGYRPTGERHYLDPRSSLRRSPRRRTASESPAPRARRRGDDDEHRGAHEHAVAAGERDSRPHQRVGDRAQHQRDHPVEGAHARERRARHLLLEHGLPDRARERDRRVGDEARRHDDQQRRRRHEREQLQRRQRHQRVDDDERAPRPEAQRDEAAEQAAHRPARHDEPPVAGAAHSSAATTGPRT